LHGYYSATHKYVEKMQKKEPTRWECVKGLFDLTSEVEDERLKKLRGGEQFLDATDVDAFLEEEISRPPGGPPTFRS
jgi:hypothetical protein